MGKLLVFFVGMVVMTVVWYVRKTRARERLREIDEGRRCIACNRTDLDAYAGNVRCRGCGHVASLSALRSAQVGDQDLSDITRPHDRGL